MKEFGKRRIYQVALVASFFGALLAPLLWLGGEKVSVMENRSLAPFPELPSSGSDLGRFAREFQEYVNDQYGFREYMIQQNRRLSRWLGSRFAEQVLEGKDGWLFYAGDERSRPLDDFTGANRLSAGELRRWAEALSERNRLLSERGVAYAFVVAPNKMEIYGEYVPDGYARRSGPSRAEQLESYLGQRSEVAFLFLADALSGGKRAAGAFGPYGKTGTHWNAFGAALGYNEIAAWLEGVFPEWKLRRYGAADFELAEVAPDRDLQRMLEGEGDGLEPGPVLRDGLRDLQWEAVRQIEGAEGSYALRRALGGGDPGRTLLVFGDSFFDALAPYLAEAFGEIYFAASRPSADEMLKVVELTGCEVVIEQRVERYLWRFPDWGN